MKWKFLIVVVCLLILQSCSENEKSNEKTIDDINAEIQEDLIFYNLSHLKFYTDDSILYNKRKGAFKKLQENTDHTIKYLENYINELENDFKKIKHVPYQFEDQITILKNNTEKIDFHRLKNQIIGVECILYEYLRNFSVDHVVTGDRLTSSVSPFKGDWKLGEVFEARAGLYLSQKAGKDWICESNIYYLSSDTLLIETIKTSYDTTYCQDIKFKPTKRGNYLLKGKNTIFHNGYYTDLEFETQFTVK